MLNKLLTFIVVIEIILLVIINPVIKKTIKYKYSINTYKVSDIDKAKLENYIIGVVAAEMPATFSIEALKAQAVAARTFAYKKIINNKLNFDNLYTDKGQAYITNEQMKNNWESKYEEYYQKISEAVISTRDEIITYRDEPINAYYFSISNGKTEDSSSVFGEQSYLISVDSSWDINNASYSKSVTIPLSEFKERLSLNEDIIINNVQRSNTNHVNNLMINNKNYTGIEFRKLFNLRSTDFDINIDNNLVTINTKGHGHGVGMSQYGANSMALEGKTYEQIIKYYYKDVKISKI